MRNILPENVEPEIVELLRDVVQWARSKEDFLALALLGSQARGDARPESDIDLLLLFKEPQIYLQSTAWTSLFGDVVRSAEENWGKVTSIRVHYSNGLEVEFGLTNGSWGSDPTDTGDQKVIDDGIIVLYEVGCHLSTQLQSVASDSGSSSADVAG